METFAHSPGLWRIGIDVGGTFTDMVLVDAQSNRTVFKVPSVPEDPSQGVLAVLEAAAHALQMSVSEVVGNCSTFIHGSTVATNTLLEGKGARVGLLTTDGFRDSLEIRRGFRHDVWNHREPFAPVLVPRFLRQPVRGRFDWCGNELEPFEDEDVEQAAAIFRQEGVEAIAVCLLHAYINPQHEEKARSLLEQTLSGHAATRWISLSSEVTPIIGEFDRSSTAVVNAYLAPRISSYLIELSAQLRGLGLRNSLLIQQSNGGALSVEQAVARPVNLVLSGPAASVGALRYFARTIGSSNLISMEIGGTSTDVTVMSNGAFALTEKMDVAGYSISISAVDIHTVGAGGGSIAGVDAANMMYVGPGGAGANPGPAAYGKGGQEPTVTDAQLVLGRLRPGIYAGGHVGLDMALAREAIERRLSTPLGISIEDAAIGILRLANQRVQQAVERISVERGVDVREFVLVACGGAGPMHGPEVARAIGVPLVHVPRQSGAFCAFGMLNADVRQDYLYPCLEVLDSDALRNMDAAFGALEEKGSALLRNEGFEEAAQALYREMNLRYAGQQWDISVQLNPDDTVETIRQRFEEKYDRLYGHTQPNGTVEICGARVIATGKMLPITALLEPAARTVFNPTEHRRVYYEHSGWVDSVPVYSGEDLCPGFALMGPMIIEEATTTLVVAPGDFVTVDPYGDYRVQVSTMEEAT